MRFWSLLIFFSKLNCMFPEKIKQTDFFAFQASTFFETLIAQKLSVFEQRCVSYVKRQESCTSIVIKVIRFYLLPLI